MGTRASSNSKALEWYDEENKVDLPSEPVIKAYDEKIVAWIDILGMRNVIKNPKYGPEDVFSIMGQLRAYVEALCDKLVANEQFYYLQIADGFIITANIECIDEMLRILATIQWRVLVETRMLLRGAVSAGQVSNSDTLHLVIGPAYIQAFELEDENAIFPRIILSNELINAVGKNLQFKHITEDSDKQYYIRFIDYIKESRAINDQEIKRILTTNGIIKQLKHSYHDCTEKKKINLVQKYGWMIQQLRTYKIEVL